MLLPLLQKLTRFRSILRVSTAPNIFGVCFYCTTSMTSNADESKQTKSTVATEFRFSSELSLEAIRQKQADFSRQRNWDQYHSPRNVLLAMVAEVGEIAECFQWKGEVKKGLPDWTEEERTHLGEELSDVLVYLIRLADRCEIDLPSAVLRKIELNSNKYPASKVYGKSDKYTEYERSNQE
ncbi:dCTP pyrophosphatase 1-like [Ornithodoros turicata]|uniref:dCTP pyrophosphatase 1-like n=1 Tax=Ornithodoros turicata TaxID=34597 RepID=UPI00313A09AE